MGSKCNSISLGDKIFVRIVSNNAIVSELTLSNINSMSELVTHLHTVLQNVKGLSTLFVRNMTKGWTTKRPMMFYSTRYSNERERNSSMSISAKSTVAFSA